MSHFGQSTFHSTLIEYSRLLSKEACIKAARERTFNTTSPLHSQELLWHYVKVCRQTAHFPCGWVNSHTSALPHNMCTLWTNWVITKYSAMIRITGLQIDCLVTEGSNDFEGAHTHAVTVITTHTCWHIAPSANASPVRRSDAEVCCYFSADAAEVEGWKSYSACA